MAVMAASEARCRDDSAALVGVMAETDSAAFDAVSTLVKQEAGTVDNEFCVRRNVLKQLTRRISVDTLLHALGFTSDLSRHRSGAATLCNRRLGDVA